MRCQGGRSAIRLCYRPRGAAVSIPAEGTGGCAGEIWPQAGCLLGTGGRAEESRASIAYGAAIASDAAGHDRELHRPLDAAASSSATGSANEAAYRRREAQIVATALALHLKNPAVVSATAAGTAADRDQVDVSLWMKHEKYEPPRHRVAETDAETKLRNHKAGTSGGGKFPRPGCPLGGGFMYEPSHSNINAQSPAPIHQILHRRHFHRR